MDGDKVSFEDRIQIANFPHKDGIIIMRIAVQGEIKKPVAWW